MTTPTVHCGACSAPIFAPERLVRVEFGDFVSLEMAIELGWQVCDVCAKLDLEDVDAVLSRADDDPQRAFESTMVQLRGDVVLER